MQIRERLVALRRVMAERGVAAYVVPSADPHQSEYPPEHWRQRAWISGFNGSAGTVVVTADAAGLWTDFRYFLEAEHALAGTGFELHRLGEPQTLDYPAWLATVLKAGDRVSFDSACVSLSASRTLEQELGARGIDVVPGDDLIAEVQDDRPALPNRPLQIHDERYAGLSRGEKLSLVRSTMTRLGAEYHLISTLDDIAWLLNIRGSDVPYNPVVVSHVIVGRSDVRLFVGDVISDDVRTELESDGVTILPYGDAMGAIAAIPEGTSVVISPTQISVGFEAQLAPGVKRIERLNITTTEKAQKHATEIEHLRNVMERDGVAMVRFLSWLSRVVGQEKVTELDAEDRLRAFRAEGANFVSESFHTISAYRGHGAIVHYAASKASNVALEPAGIYLVDSGAQYQDGTTDITRTVALGPVSEQARRDFTLVLKGHIGLATLRFPAGTTGPMIDVVAREHLWREHMTYGHGTGHGVGFFLNVHEGPQRISQYPNDIALRPGMIISNEPGVYRTDQYGIRVENLVVVVEDATSEFGVFLAFETLSLCPIDRSLIDVSILTDAEREWIDAYHRRVRDKLLGHLNAQDAAWLDAACAPLEVTR